MFRSSQFCRNWHLSSLLLCQWNLRWVLKTSPASAGIVSWQSGELCCLLHLALQATWACWQSCWRQIMPHRGQMSLTVRARDWRPSKKYKPVIDLELMSSYHFLFLLTEVELSCVIESISTINPRIEWKKITSGGPSYVYFDKKIYGNTWSSL